MPAAWAEGTRGFGSCEGIAWWAMRGCPVASFSLRKSLQFLNAPKKGKMYFWRLVLIFIFLFFFFFCPMTQPHSWIWTKSIIKYFYGCLNELLQNLITWWRLTLSPLWMLPLEQLTQLHFQKDSLKKKKEQQCWNKVLLLLCVLGLN